MKKLFLCIGIVLCLIVPLYSASSSNYDIDLNIGIEYNLADESGEARANLIGVNLKPDISIGNWGIGLVGSFRFELGTDPVISFVSDDWVPDFSEDTSIIGKAQTVASLYLPVIRYVRYGWKGDPIYAKIGEIDDITIGTGIFVNGYSNTVLQPRLSMIGTEIDVDGNAFGFPYVGFESFISDLALYDVMGGRIYVRPLAFMDFPLLHNFQIGGSIAVDNQPNAHAEFAEDPQVVPENIMMYGADMMMPIVNSSLFGMTLYGDIASQKKEGASSMAYRTGFMGNMLGFFHYRADVTFPKAGFKPDYFNKNYDLDRSIPYLDPGIAADNLYLHANAGFDLFEENLVFDLNIRGDITTEDSMLQIESPSMEAYFKLGEGILPFFYFDGTYTKNNLTGDTFQEFFDDVISPTKDSTINANVTIKYSILETTLGYIINFDEDGNMTTQGLKIAGDFEIPLP